MQLREYAMALDERCKELIAAGEARGQDDLVRMYLDATLQQMIEVSQLLFLSLYLVRPSHESI